MVVDISDPSDPTLVPQMGPPFEGNLGESSRELHEGRFKNEIEHIEFLEGNSNQGDALCFEPVGEPPDDCD